MKEFKIVQRKRDELIIYLLKDENMDKKVKQFISSMVKKHIDPSMTVKFEQVEKIEAEASGKKRYFINEISG